ncbi:hypothetical protein N7466_010477 [Penicillium verhagenii]|uniref:uncharacterized protein n=1 Tax=Penicillium verhagenii TaxID=1562060 RepID=UPI0025458796|nr:uncharacterized protein N7466_010477 [Penicillium verhagenii]KAJ5918485.1 hypothetical protein N7466_010477 [Penicillium verhagenii]
MPLHQVREQRARGLNGEEGEVEGQGQRDRDEDEDEDGGGEGEGGEKPGDNCKIRSVVECRRFSRSQARKPGDL